MDSSDAFTIFRWRLAETIAWCSERGSLIDPVNSLRTPDLKPECMAGEPTYGYEWGDNHDKQVLIGRLCEKRADLLRLLGKYPAAPAQNLANGRLLLSDPENSDICGLSEPQSEGFIDGYDITPWDTWLWYSEEAVTHNEAFVRKRQAEHWRLYKMSYTPSVSVRYWICWIPEAFLPLVDEGISVNPVECFFWASEYKAREHDTPFLCELEAAGFLR